MSTYTLQNAEDQARTYPDDFNIPDLKDRKTVPDGHFAKVGFVTESNSGSKCVEYLWVRVIDRESDDGTYYGVLEDEPNFTNGVKIGDPIQFEAENVFKIIAPR